jgi:hypothetical protein
MTTPAAPAAAGDPAAAAQPVRDARHPPRTALALSVSAVVPQQGPDAATGRLLSADAERWQPWLHSRPGRSMCAVTGTLHCCTAECIQPCMVRCRQRAASAAVLAGPADVCSGVCAARLLRGLIGTVGPFHVAQLWRMRCTQQAMCLLPAGSCCPRGESRHRVQCSAVAIFRSRLVGCCLVGSMLQRLCAGSTGAVQVTSCGRVVAVLAL